MKTSELNQKLVEILETLRQAQPGAGSSVVRAAARQRAGTMAGMLPAAWWLQADPSLVAHYQQLA